MKKKILLLLLISIVCMISWIISEYYKINSHNYWAMFGFTFGVAIYETILSIWRTKQ